MQDFYIELVCCETGKKLCYTFIYNYDFNLFISNFFDELTLDFMQVENDLENDFISNYKNALILNSDILKNEIDKILYSDFKNVWNKYNKNYICITFEKI